VALAIAVVAGTVFALVRDEAAGFVAALLAGLLLAPYTLLYAASILLVAVRPALRVSPVGTRVLALIANPTMMVAMGAWSAAALASVVMAARRRHGAPGSAGQDTPPPGAQPPASSRSVTLAVDTPNRPGVELPGANPT
jgi:hypothetical protein